VAFFSFKNKASTKLMQQLFGNNPFYHMQTTKLLPINFIHIFIDKRLTPAYNNLVLKKSIMRL